MTRKAPSVYSPGSPAAQDLLYIQALPAEKRERVLLRDLSSLCPHVDMRTKNFWRISEEKSPKFSKSNGKVPVVIWGSLYPSADMRFRNLDPECGQRLIISLLFRGTENRPAVIYIPVSGIPIPSLCDCDTFSEQLHLGTEQSRDATVLLRIQAVSIADRNKSAQTLSRGQCRTD